MTIQLENNYNFCDAQIVKVWQTPRPATDWGVPTEE